MGNTNKAIVLSQDNPFRQDVMKHQRLMKTTSRTNTTEGYKQRRITVIEETEYFPGAFAKLFQNKELLQDLSPDACKILVRMAMCLTWNEEKLELRAEVVGLERRRFSKAMVELLTRRILAKERPHWYWVNITLMIVGHIEKHDENKEP